MPRRAQGPRFGNLFTDVTRRLVAERTDVLVNEASVRLERIISTGHATAPGDWHDQDRDEWVVVLRGSAGLRFEGDAEVLEMHVGDHLVIPAHRRHRVEWTDSQEPTVWLAVHYSGAGAGSRSRPHPPAAQGKASDHRRRR
jgi:cupin 2 domain-containing protein